jgi:hypothetical protein
MMPIIIGAAASVPVEYHQFLPLLSKCPVSRDEWGKVGYLTIDEHITDGGSHRRGGIHTEGGYELESLFPEGQLAADVQARLLCSGWENQEDVSVLSCQAYTSLYLPSRRKL